MGFEKRQSGGGRDVLGRWLTNASLRAWQIHHALEARTRAVITASEEGPSTRTRIWEIRRAGGLGAPRDCVSGLLIIGGRSEGLPASPGMFGLTA